MAPTCPPALIIGPPVARVRTGKLWLLDKLLSERATLGPDG